MFCKISVLTIFLTVGILNAQQPVDECPPFEDVEGVDLINEKLTGIWYLHASIARFFEYDMKCTFINVTALGPDHLYFVKHEFNNETNDHRESFGTIEFTRNGSCNFFYTALQLPFEYHTIALTEDYWALVACSECGFFSDEGAGIYVYIFTKLQYPPCELNSEVKGYLEEYYVYTDYVISHDQNNCPFC